MDQLFLAWQGVHDGEGGRRQPMPLCHYPTQPLCNVAGDTRVSEALMQQGSAHFGASSYASCSRPASLPQIRGVEYSGAGRLGMGLHDSMRRLAKIARNAHGHLVLDIDLPQSRATCLAASSLAPLHNTLAWVWIPIWTQPLFVVPLGCWSSRKCLSFVLADTHFSWVNLNGTTHSCLIPCPSPVRSH